MKAITCSQCGALIKRIRIRDKFAECEYCHATIPILKDKVIVIPDKEKPINTNTQVPLQSYVKYSSKYETDPYGSSADPVERTILGALIFGTILIVFGLVALLFYVNSPSPGTNTFDEDQTDTSAVDTQFEIPTPVRTPTPAPIPKISYRSYVKYNSNLGAEHIELPTLEAERLPTFDKKELKKTVFKQKRIRVSITINKDGEVTDARALNGHEVLQESSVRAAKKSLFSSRRGQGKATLTYIYLLEE